VEATWGLEISNGTTLHDLGLGEVSRVTGSQTKQKLSPKVDRKAQKHLADID